MKFSLIATLLGFIPHAQFVDKVAKLQIVKLLKKLKLQSMYKFWIKIVSLIFIFIFSAYLFYLNNIVKSQFSAEVEISNNITQINYSFNDYPPELINMLLLVEDQSYFHHHGVDFKEIGRVIYGYLFDNKALRGASTITQQLVKNSLLTREKTFSESLKRL